MADRAQRVHDGGVRIGETGGVRPGVWPDRGSGAASARAVSRSTCTTPGGHGPQGGADDLNAAQVSVAEAIKDLTGGRGADVCFEVTGSTRALNEAIRAAAYSARVVAMGFFQGEAQGLFLGEEFHHNRINVVCSQISGTDPELKYRWDKLRLWQSAIRLQADGLLDLRPLISHTAPFERAAELYALLDQAPEQVMQAVLEFS